MLSGVQGHPVSKGCVMAPTACPLSGCSQFPSFLSNPSEVLPVPSQAQFQTSNVRKAIIVFDIVQSLSEMGNNLVCVQGWCDDITAVFVSSKTKIK